MQLSLALCIITGTLSDALAPTRRRTALQKLTVGALGLTTAQRAAAATNAEAEKVRVASRELTELLRNEDALRFKVLVEGSGKLPIAVSFITFQKLEKDCGDYFMGAAIEYAETYKDAKDLVKLARPRRPRTPSRGRRADGVSSHRRCSARATAAARTWRRGTTSARSRTCRRRPRSSTPSSSCCRSRCCCVKVK